MQNIELPEYKPHIDLSTNRLAAKKLLFDHIKHFQIPSENLCNWYIIAKKLLKSGKFVDLMTREETIEMGALMLQVDLGDKNEKQQPRKQLRSLHRYKDSKMYGDIIQEHGKLRGLERTEAKRRFVNTIRVFKRVMENIFDCFLYSADNISVNMRKILLIISERIVIMDANNQIVVNDVPIDSVRSLNNRHVSSTEREVYKSIRKRLNSAVKLHLLVMDLGGPSIALLTESRHGIREVFETCLNGFRKTQNHLLTERLERMTPPVKSVPLKKIDDLYPLGSGKQNRFFFSFENDDVLEIGIKFQGGVIVVEDVGSKEEKTKIMVEDVVSWKKEHIFPELEEKDTSSTGESVSRITLTVKSGPPLNILGDPPSLSSLSEKLKTTLPTDFLQEYECILVKRELKFFGILKFSLENLVITDRKDGGLLRLVPTETIQEWRIMVAPSEFLTNFPQRAMFEITLDDPEPLQILCDEPTSVETDLKKIILLLWHKHKKATISKPLYTAVPCKLFSKKKAKTVEVQLFTKDRAVVLTSDANYGSLVEFPVDAILGWDFGINISSNENILFFSKRKASVDTFQNEINILQESHLFDSTDSDSD